MGAHRHRETGDGSVMNGHFSDETQRTLFHVNRLMKRNALKRAKNRPFSRLFHETQLVNRALGMGWMFHIQFLGVPVKQNRRARAAIGSRKSYPRAPPLNKEILLVQMPDGKLVEQYICTFDNIDAAKKRILQRAQYEWDAHKDRQKDVVTA